MDEDEDSFEVPDHPGGIPFCLVKRFGVTHLDVFLKLLPIDLLQKVWNERRNGDWSYAAGSRMINHGNFSLPLVPRFLAVKLRILARHHTFISTGTRQRNLREDIVEAIEYFKIKSDDTKTHVGINQVEAFLAKFLLSHEYFADLSEFFRWYIRNVGEFVSGDEKLWPFTGYTSDVKHVPGKNPPIGLWMYVLACMLDEDTPYVIDIKMWESEVHSGEKDRVNQTVMRWAAIVEQLQIKDGACILSMDSYYLDNAGRDRLEESGVKFVASVNKQRFQPLVKMVEPYVQKEGHWAAVINEATNELFVHVWDPNKDIGRKFVLGNAMEHHVGNGVGPHEKPLYDLYKLTFRAVDKFNQLAHGKDWTHKHGGFKRNGSAGSEDEYALVTLLLNSCILHRRHENLFGTAFNFSDMILKLSDDLFAYSVTVN